MPSPFPTFNFHLIKSHMLPLSLPLNLASVTTHTDLDISAALMVQTIKLTFDTSCLLMAIAPRGSI